MAFRSLGRRRLRTGLTVSGIVVGVAMMFMGLVKGLNKKRNQTFIIVTHDPLVVHECTKAYTIRDGQIERELPKEEMDRTTL